jgi:polar amino acid transport system substrate-binding protein
MSTHLRQSRSARPLRLVILALSIAGTAQLGGAQQMSAAVRSELAPTGRLRVGINFGNALLAVKDSSGKPGGIAVLLAQELSRRVNLPMDIVPYESAGRMADGVKTGAWDVAFLAADPDRAGEIGFTAPYLEIDSTYLVPANSPLRTQQDVDRAGVRIAVSAKSAYDLYLTRELKHAQLRRVPTSRSICSTRTNSTRSPRSGRCSQIWLSSTRAHACSTGGSRSSRRLSEHREGAQWPLNT